MGRWVSLCPIYRCGKWTSGRLSGLHLHFPGCNCTGSQPWSRNTWYFFPLKGYLVPFNLCYYLPGELEGKGYESKNWRSIQLRSGVGNPSKAPSDLPLLGWPQGSHLHSTSSIYKMGIILTSQAGGSKRMLAKLFEDEKTYINGREALGSLAYHSWQGPGRCALTAHNRLCHKENTEYIEL